MALDLPSIGEEGWGPEVLEAFSDLDVRTTAAQADADAAQATATTAQATATSAASAASDAASDAADAAADAAAAEAAVAGKLDATITRSAPGATTHTVNLNYVTDTADPDLEIVNISGVQVSWRNENGHYRARVANHALWDSTFRAIQVTGQTGNPFEYENVARDNRIWSIDPDDGATKRFDVKMNDVLVLGAADPIPANTPAGTVIMRTA